MFHKEFYPTPRYVLDLMQLDVAGKNVLEPHGGKGDIIDYVKEKGANKVYFSEIVPELATICANKGAIEIGDDFLKLNSLPPVDVIVMNPPFSNADKHIVHAFNISPSGCTIYALCNYETVLKNEFGSYRRRLGQIIKNHGEAMDLGSVFSDAERKTNVSTGFVKLHKPISESGFDFDSYFIDDTESYSENGIMPYNVVRDIVQRHVNAIKQFETVRNEVNKLNELASKVGLGDLEMSYNRNSTGRATTVEEFIRVNQRHSWNFLFKEFNVEKFLTKASKEKLHQYMESKHGTPFTMKQVYHVIDVVVQTREQNLLQGLCDVMSAMTRNAYLNDNETWKTNYPNKIGEKFIMSGLFERQEYSFGIRTPYYSSYRTFEMSDFMKVCSYVLGYNFDELTAWDEYLSELSRKANEGELKLFGQWYDYNFLEVKFFKKGTTHVKFKRASDCNLLNKKYAEAFDKLLSQNVK
jgi:hypothetical protein